MRLFALQGQTLFAPRFRSAQPWAHAHNPAPPRGVGDAASYNTIRRASHYRKRPRRPGGRPPYIPLYHIPWGGPSPATHSRHPVGAGHARPLQGGVNELRAKARPTECGKVGCRAACPQAAADVCGNEKPCGLCCRRRRPRRPAEVRGCERGPTVERSEIGERTMFAPAGQTTA